METPFDRVRLDRLMEEAGIDLVYIDCRESEPILRIERNHFAADGRPIERCVNYFNPERCSYRLQLQRHGTAGPD